MATYYSSAWKQMLLGTTVRYEPIPVPIERAGNLSAAYAQITVPVGFTTGDIIKLIPFQTNTPTATPQIAGIRQSRVIIKCAGNVGGSSAVNFGYASASATAYGSALTTLQSANTTEIAVATVMAGPTLLGNDDLQLVATAGTSTTLQLVECWVFPFMQAP